MSSVLLYELNEVPWEIIDLYVENRPDSHVARLVAKAENRTTHTNDPDHLSPWGTWPTFHTGLHRAEHNSHQLGQDPETFRGTNIWDVAEAAGKSIGLFGALQTWPPRPFRHGAFYVPDTIARTPETIPTSLEGFQRFNLSMTNELGFSADQPLSLPGLASAGLGLVARGMTPWSSLRLAGHLARERREARYKAGRSIMQALPAFDLFWRLQRKHKPDLSIFFTNHVAGMMHRFWGDTFPAYAEKYGYQADPIYGEFVIEAMDIFDHQLGRIMRYLDANPDTVLIVAASMGQGPIPYNHIGETYVIEDTDAFAAALKLGPASKGMAMYPMNALEFPSHEAAKNAGELLGLIEVGGHPLIDEVEVFGESVTYKIRAEYNQETLPRDLEYRTSPGGEPIQATLEDLGWDTAKRLGGGNTAYHVPDGIYITYGADIAPDGSRETFDVRDASARIMTHLDLAEAWADTRGVREH
jgi:hypothetical protein